jgi:hypothetical protein
MAIKTVTRPDGRTARFGRKHRVGGRATLKLKNYMIPGVTPPASTNYAAAAAPALAEMYENDSLGDCVIAGIQHVEGVMTGNEPATPLIYTTAQTTAFYSGACGYVPGNPNTDEGCDIETTITWWMKNGAPSGSAHKPLAYLEVDPTNQAEVQTAIWLFENLIIGLDLPDAWITPFPSASGFTWDVAGPPDPQNGHCPPGIDYNSNGIIISTWAMTGLMTYAALAYYCAAAQEGECYVVFSQDTLNAATGLAPTGLNYAQMIADWNAMGGNLTPPVIPPPSPPPSPPPPPPPPPGTAPSHVALDQALTALGRVINEIQNPTVRSNVQKEFRVVSSQAAAYETAVAAGWGTTAPSRPPQQDNPQPPRRPGGGGRGK